MLRPLLFHAPARGLRLAHDGMRYLRLATFLFVVAAVSAQSLVVFELGSAETAPAISGSPLAVLDLAAQVGEASEQTEELGHEEPAQAEPAQAEQAEHEHTSQAEPAHEAPAHAGPAQAEPGSGQPAHDEQENEEEDPAHDAPGNGESAHEHRHPQIVLLYLFVSLTLGSFTLHVSSRWFPSVPYTCILLIEGIVLGVLHHLHTKHDFLGPLGESLDNWTSIPPHLILYTFLPALLYTDSVTLNFHLVRKSFLQCVLLAGPGILVGTGLTAMVAKLLFPYGWGWNKSFLFGSILGATDPVAVVALLKDLGASPKITMIVAGESLLNDGTAIVLFNLFLATSLAEPAPAGPGNTEELDAMGAPDGVLFPDVRFITVFFIKLALGGVLWGVFTGLITVFWAAFANNKVNHTDTIVQISVMLCAAYLTFFIAEFGLGVSGVISTVTSAVVVAALGWPLFNSPETVEHVFHFIEFVGNTLIFMLAGSIIGTTTFEGRHIHAVDFLYILLNYTLLTLIRFAMVFLFFPLLSRMGYGMLKREAVMLSWGGLRGAVGLALALQVAESQWDPEGASPSGPRFGGLMLFHVGGIAVLTLLFNGLTSKPLLRILGMLTEDKAKKNVMTHVERCIHDHCEKVFEEEVAKLEMFTQEQRDKVVNSCGCLSEETPRLTIAGIAHDRVGKTKTTAVGGKTIDVSFVGGPEKIVATREFFLQNVKAAYSAMTESGVLRQDGPQEMILRISVECGFDHMDDGLKDIDAVLKRLDIENLSCCKRMVRGFFARLTAALALHEHGAMVHHHDRTAAYTLMCFIQAHHSAQDAVQNYLGTGSDYSAQETIIDESNEALRLAQALLDQTDPQIVEDVAVQQVAFKVLASERGMIEHLHKSNVLDDSQAHHLLHRVHHDAGHVLACDTGVKVVPLRVRLEKSPTGELKGSAWQVKGKLRPASHTRASRELVDALGPRISGIEMTDLEICSEQALIGDVEATPSERQRRFVPPPPQP